MISPDGLSLQLQPRVIPNPSAEVAPGITPDSAIGLDQVFGAVSSLAQLGINPDNEPSLDTALRATTAGFFLRAGIDVSKTSFSFPRQETTVATSAVELEGPVVTNQVTASPSEVPQAGISQPGVTTQPDVDLGPQIPMVRFTRQAAETNPSLSSTLAANPEPAPEQAVEGLGNERRMKVQPSPESLLDPRIAAEEATIRSGLLTPIAAPLGAAEARLQAVAETHRDEEGHLFLAAA